MLVDKILLLKGKLAEMTQLMSEVNEARKQAVSKQEIISKYMSDLKADHEFELIALKQTLQQSVDQTKASQSELTTLQAHLAQLDATNLAQRQALSTKFYAEIDALKLAFEAEKQKALREQKSLLLALSSQKQSQLHDNLI